MPRPLPSLPPKSRTIFKLRTFLALLYLIFLAALFTPLQYYHQCCYYLHHVFDQSETVEVIAIAARG